MVARVHTVAFSGIDVLDVDAQVTIASGLPTFMVVGLPDKAVAESRERVRAALNVLVTLFQEERAAIEGRGLPTVERRRLSTQSSRTGPAGRVIAIQTRDGIDT